LEREPNLAESLIVYFRSLILRDSYCSELVIATAGTDEKVKFVEQHGAKGVNYKTQNFADEVRFLSSLSFSLSQLTGST